MTAEQLNQLESLIVLDPNDPEYFDKLLLKNKLLLLQAVEQLKAVQPQLSHGELRRQARASIPKPESEIKREMKMRAIDNNIQRYQNRNNF